MNVAPPAVSGSGFTGKPLTCETGTWQQAAETWITWYRSNKVGPIHPRYRAPSQFDLGNFSTPAEAEYGTDALTWTDSLVVGQGVTYVPTADDVGKTLHCEASADNGGATVFKTAAAPEILSAAHADTPVGGSVAATLSLSLGGPVSFGAFTPGVAREYTAQTTATVISSAGDATLAVSDPGPNAGHLVNGAFALAQPLQGLGVVKTYDAPVSNDSVLVVFRQAIGAYDALRTGSYAKSLTFTLSTTAP